MRTLDLLIGVGGLVVVAVILLVRNHRRWLAEQSPFGVWIASTEAGRVMLQFEGDREKGTYSQVTQTDSRQLREWGIWRHASGRLELLMMGTDIEEHPRFGENTVYRVSYVGPQSISINGPDRYYVTYERAPAGTTVNVVPDGASLSETQYP
jgi:hypothetical protein